MLHDAKWSRRRFDDIYVDPERLRMSNLFTPPIIEGTDVHRDVTGLYWPTSANSTTTQSSVRMLQRWTLMPGSEDDGEGDDDDAVQKAGDDGANGDALDDDTLEVDLDDAAQDGHDQTTFQYSAVRNTEFLKTPKRGQHLATKSGECRICKKDEQFR
jgi:hypothetical protein